MRGLGRFIAAAALCAVCALPASATAAPTPQPYRHNDFGGFHDILPAGENGFASDADLLAWELDHNTRPAHSNDQYAMYRDLQYATPLSMSQIGSYYKDSSFGFPPGHDERTYSPRSDVTIVRDSDFGVPHVYGSTRAGAMFGLGYATAEDRLFFIDALRHAGRAQLSSFAGGANREMDEGVWADTPYTEKDLERQLNYSPPGYHQAAAQLRDDAQNYVAGINHYIMEARANKVQKMPAEYAAIGKPTGPGLWKPTDLISEAALIGGIFGNGGGNELNSALTLEAAIQKFGPRKGVRVWRDFRDAEDPEAPLTARIGRFPYEVPPRHPHGVALPDPGSLKRAKVVASTSGSASSALTHYLPGSSATPPLPPGINTDGLTGGLHRGNSNALLISARESKTGRPVAVMGPQVAYFNPEILMEQDVHAPTLDARGAAFPGVNLYVQLGRGRDYSWSATSSGQDVIDTFAVPLCEPNGSAPTRSSNHYLFRGRCLRFQTLTRTISWQPNLGDTTPAGSETLKTKRSKLGIVIGRARVNGRPVAYTKLRTSYRHEIDSALGFSYFNSPNKIHNARDFQRAAYLISFTFNWFYVDNRDIAYFNSGGNPERAPGTDPNFPVLAVPGNYWRGFDASKNTMTLTPFRQHPQVINQSYITSWNNKQAHGYRAADDNYHYGPIYRSSLLNEQIRRRIAGPKKIGLNQLIDSMELAGTTDLRGDFVLPLALRVMRRRPIADPALRKAVNQLGAWVRAGAHRIDRDKNGTYAHSDAIRIMDAWWPLWLRAEFRPTIGTNFFNHVEGMNVFDDPNRTGHLGSAFDDGWYGYANKDLRTILGRNVKGRFSRVYCGSGSLARCRRALLHSLSHALGVNPYGENSGCGVGDDQMCSEAIHFRTVGGIAQPDMPWINRPTYQQALSIKGHRPR